MKPDAKNIVLGIRYNKIGDHGMKNALTTTVLAAAGLSFLFSVTLCFNGVSWDVSPETSKQYGIFVGLWVPSILGLGCYFKKDV